MKAFLGKSIFSMTFSEIARRYALRLLVLSIITCIPVIITLPSRYLYIVVSVLVLTIIALAGWFLYKRNTIAFKTSLAKKLIDAPREKKVELLNSIAELAKTNQIKALRSLKAIEKYILIDSEDENLKKQFLDLKEFLSKIEKTEIYLHGKLLQIILILQICYIFGTYNIGHQHFLAIGQYIGLFEGFHLKLTYGIIQLFPIWLVTHLVGLGVEYYYSARHGHKIDKYFLLSAAIIPLIMPPDIPLWILAIAVAFAIMISKEAFGGTGMNILNIALLARVFIFFAYPTEISGDEVWIAGLEKVGNSFISQEYGFVYGFLDSIFSGLGLDTFGRGGIAVVDGFSGATPLSLAFEGGWAAVTDRYTVNEMLWGTIPGSVGETSKPIILIGAFLLILEGIASWRIMLSMLFGAITMAILLNAWGATPIMEVPWPYHFFMGSFFFTMAFMATDPDTAATTDLGKWIYGFLIGITGMIIRVVNPAYPEGWMLALLFMNVFAPLIDYYVLTSSLGWKLSREKVKI